MCGRFTLVDSAEALERQFCLVRDEEALRSYRPRFNIAPGQGILTVLDGGAGSTAKAPRGAPRLAKRMFWGFPVSRAGQPGRRCANARSETAHTLSSFRGAFRARRCLVPASGFYEWQRRSGGAAPWYFSPVGGGIWGLAGLWTPDPGDSQAPGAACCLLTTVANQLVGGIHHRMPVILLPNDWEAWLDGSTSTEDLVRMAAPLAEHGMKAHAVGERVNSSRHDDPSLVDPVNRAPDPQLELFGEGRSSHSPRAGEAGPSLGPL